MLKKRLVTILIAVIFLSTFVITYAQENKVENKVNKIAQHQDMQKNMKSIASDSKLRIQMIDLMIQNCEGDKNAMMEMGQTMIKNPEMHKMIKKMVNENEHIKVLTKTNGKSKEHMIMESTKTIKKPKYDAIQK